MSELSSPGGQPLIIDDAKEGVFRVHRLAYTSDELFEREQREIYDHCWLLLGHESEISQPGDFKTRTIALRPIIFCRDDAGEVRAFINSCPHRGAELCREIEGLTPTSSSSSSLSSGIGTRCPSSAGIDTRARRRVPAAIRAERSAEFSRSSEGRWTSADLLSRLRRSFGGSTLFTSQRFSGIPRI